MDYIEINKQAWNKRTLVHFDSKFYDVAGFLEGKTSLNPIELAQVGNVQGKSLLHLQCHFGLDSLSWSRLGAKVTGVDLSSDAIDKARWLADKLVIDANFIESDLYHFGAINKQQFDLVFSSYGALCWLPDLNGWAQIISDALNEGGELHLVEFHGITDLLSGYAYFAKDQPDVEQEGTYTENCVGEKSTTVCWSHSLSEVINALLCAGLTLVEVNEYPYSPYNCFEGLEFVEGEGYQLLYKGQQVPLVYAIKARK
ncbi:class I SAM-dependent methyltransferase [Shewanella sp. Isolate11]|uniref:class I SAM-dependent methyltransferase n=1 Tax=Shewanella sp. Isolate11 TaxID=2908530 RepID=UPI001EFC6473|nr:class I SAM-dependent methyltransferase [Shewanella sp. Isolate11]MCG9696921.1 class I SAM-dependent methyltransferase [Shewanella sp. Isolate11]